MLTLYSDNQNLWGYGYIGEVTSNNDGTWKNLPPTYPTPADWWNPANGTGWVNLRPEGAAMPGRGALEYGSSAGVYVPASGSIGTVNLTSYCLTKGKGADESCLGWLNPKARTTPPTYVDEEGPDGIDDNDPSIPPGDPSFVDLIGDPNPNGLDDTNGLPEYTYYVGIDVVGPTTDLTIEQLSA
ncbi:MAG: hypothetical protein LBR29_04065, partial [Methylobacteriaceae bacterium]|nr:hypothetical protein [Methylobacteriaceae bacterium]